MRYEKNYRIHDGNGVCDEYVGTDDAVNVGRVHNG